MSFTADAEIITKALTHFRENSISAQRPVINQECLETLIHKLNLRSYIRSGGLTKENLSEFINQYLSYATRLHHPSYFGHQCAPTHYAGALGSFVDGFTNNVMAVYEMGPAAASIEYFMINWLLEKVGWQPAPLKLSSKSNQSDFGGGVLVNGGSIANLTALIIARNRIVPEVWQEGSPPDLAILSPSESHYSIDKAAGILGIGKNSIYSLEVDGKGAIVPEKLPVALNRLLNDGKRPIALIANACSTSVGIYDPLEEIAAFCRENHLWLHVDGAHGASALISEKHKGCLKGVEKADSLIWDAHKLLQTPSLCAALLVREHRHLDTGIHQEASYLFHEKEQPGFDFIQRTIECTKSGLGVKLFFVVAAIGEKGLAEYIDKQYDLAMKSYEYIQKQNDFECPVVPQSNILCFRIEGSDQKQISIRNKLTAEGSFYLTTTLFNEKRYLRLVFMSSNTRLLEVHNLIDRIREINDVVEKFGRDQNAF